MHRFFCQQADFSKSIVQIDDTDEVHHMKDVLRLKVGDKVNVFNGAQEEASCIIAGLNDQRVQLKVQHVNRPNDRPRTKIILACAPPKKAKFEFILEKVTELGVNAIIPLQTKRSEVIYTKEKGESKQSRFQKVLLNAAKQSGRLDIPEIHPMMSLKEACALLPSDCLKLIPSLVGENKNLREVLALQNAPRELAIFIGPEGDFTPQEVSFAIEQGCLPVSLGQSVLKVDTAAIYACSIARFMYGT